MTESDIKINISKNINNILKSVYNNISNDGFNPFLDLSSVPTSTLRDFWLHTTGFLGLQNQECFDKTLTDQEVIDILKGDFRLIDLPLDQAQEFALRSKKKVPSKGVGLNIKLYSVQDGVYSIKKGAKDEKGNTYNCLALQTNPLEYYSDVDPENINVSPRDVLKACRNVFAHSLPLKKGKALVFERGNDEIVVSKMWLRGYAELFCRKSNTLNSSKIEEMILQNLSLTNNQISNKKELDEVLSSIKSIYGADIIKNFYKLSLFVNSRISQMQDFYGLPIETKVKTISSILAHNSDYITTNQGEISPSIIYNIQQLVGLELYARGEVTSLGLEDYDIEKMKKLITDIEDFNQRTVNLSVIIKTKGSLSKPSQQKYLKDLGSLKSKVGSYLQNIEDRKKLETSNMDLYNIEDLNYLPLEVAVNTVLLMSFNSLVTSSFYDDVLSKTDTASLSVKQAKFFDRFNTDNFEFFYNNNLRQSQNPGQKAYFLLCLREALCHGRVSYCLPNTKKGAKPNFKDAIICFKTTERQNSEIYGTVQDFFDLFSSKEFTATRDSEIVTNTSKEYTQEEIKLNKLEEFNYQQLNSIVQELKKFDDSLKSL